VHDSNDLDIVYGVIDLIPYDVPGASKINRKRIDRAKKKYASILNLLSLNPDNSEPECRRVAGLFGHRRQTAVFKKAADRVRCQVGQKDRFVAGLIRSGAYLEQIRDILRSYGVPEDLAYLPHVESSFNPKAYSKFGAAGMWQFTRDTGKRFMQVGYVLDERLDPIIATHAAAQLLKENHAKLNSWPLAVTAYNHGSAGMKQAKEIHGDYPAIFKSYQGRTFKFASRNFYSEFLAARQVADNYKAYFGDLVLDRPGRTRTIVLKDYFALEDLQRHLDLDTQTLAELNPALLSPVFNGQKYIPKGYKLRLPEGSGIQGSNLIVRIPQYIYKSSQKPSRFYKVQRGDTAGKIARIHGVGLEDLILANDLNQHATIYPHQNLRIPLP
jgi:membrane-bound lytic murein transglycosylase D